MVNTETASKPRPTPAEFPLTAIQMGMVYESTLAARPWVNLEQVVVHLDDEALEPVALGAAWGRVAQRHAALRLRILWRGREQPVQSLAPDPIAPPLTVEDWQSLPPAAQDEALARFLDADRAVGVDLEQGPSWRVALFRLGARKSVMVWTIHHALIDGRSIAMVLQDLFAALADAAAFADVRPPSLDFAGFCAAAEPADTRAAQAHFTTALDGFDQPNTLAQPQPAPVSPLASRHRQIERRLDPDLTAALSARAERAQVTLASMVHAAWGLVVARHSGRGDAVFGVTRSGRHALPGAQDLVGCLINTLPLRLDIATPATVDDLLRQVRAASVAMRPHEFASLTEVRRWAGLPATLPLFDSMVMFERASLTETLRARDPSWSRRRVTLHEEGALPLTLAVHGDPCLAIALEHDPARIPDALAETLLSHFTTLLAALAHSDATTPLWRLSMLPPADAEALVALGRPDGPLAPEPACIATRFEARVRAQPHAPALSQVGQDRALDYETLDRRANGLAHRLRAEGAGPGQIVAIGLDRSVDFVVSMLAILKTGAAFLPVDPAYPEPVIDHMLRDSGARLMLARNARRHPAGLNVLSPVAPASATPPDRDTGPAIDPDRLAYVIYTSGSTGKPKGVRVPQRAVSAHASAIIHAFGLTPADRCLQFASLSFDVSIEEMIPTLLSGGELVLRDAGMAQSISAFLDAVEARGLSVLNLPTAFWHILVDDMATSGRPLPAPVRLVIAGGERINARSLATWQRLVPGVRWLNGYGPTETTITCTLHEPGPVAPDDDIPIGRPTRHARAYVLAADGSLAPRGCPGDLWIGGAAVSDGYIGQPERTAQLFRPDHLAGHGRIYRTGDRAFWRPDGTLGFLGRQDRQVKMRGFRIDLRHIETVLEREPGVGRAMVRVLDAGSPAARLVAWVTGADGLSPPDPETLAQAAMRNLAPHMRPAIVPIDEFPRTPGGKIDTNALPAPSARAQAGASASDEPADARTRQIARMMGALLRQEPLGPDEDFVALGGHSLLAVRLIGQIEAAFGLRVAVGDLHRNPTPRTLSAAIDAANLGPRYIIPIQPGGSLPPLFGVHVLGHNEEFYRPLAAELGPDQPVLGLTVGLVTKDTPIGVEKTARCYFEEIQQHYPTGPIGLAAVSLGSYIAFELARLLHEAGRQVHVVALFDAEGPGGRSRLKGLAWTRAHLGRLRHEGIGYFSHVLSNRLSDLRYRLTRRKLTLAADQDDFAPLTLSAFVAANEMAVEAYHARPLAIPLTIFRALDDVFDTPDCYREGLGWAGVAQAGFTMTDVPGDHLSILEPPNVSILARHLRAAMAGRPKGQRATAPQEADLAPAMPPDMAERLNAAT